VYKNTKSVNPCTIEEVDEIGASSYIFYIVNDKDVETKIEVKCNQRKNHRNSYRRLGNRKRNHLSTLIEQLNNQ